MANTRSKKASQSPLSNWLDTYLLKSWWVLLFFLLAFFAYEQAVKRRTQEEKKLQEKIEMLQLAKQEALLTKEQLQLEIASQEDDAWIELVLMQKLGLVPEGYTKVHFVNTHILVH